MARAAAQVYKINDVYPKYAAQTTKGTPVATSTSWDPASGGTAYLRPNTRTQRYIGGGVFRQGGIIRAGIENLEFNPRSATLIDAAIRGSASDPTGTWAYGGLVQPFTIRAGNTAEHLVLDWAKIDTLELTQEFPAGDDASPLKATANIIAATAAQSTDAFAQQSQESLSTLMSFMCAMTLNSLAADALKIRRYRLYINNNHEYMTFGDSDSSDRVAAELRAGQEEVEFEVDVEIPLEGSTSDTLYDAVCYAPWSMGGTIVYTNNCTGGVAATTTITLSNLVLSDDGGFEESYEAEGADREPVKVFTFKFVKNNPRLVSVAAATV